MNSITFKEKLEATKTFYPFEKWREMFFSDEDDDGGMEQYTQENCDAAKTIFDNLINKLVSVGENAPEKDKVELFKIAIESLNELNDSEGAEGLIETGEREDLCELIDQITIAAGLNPTDYADGEGIADEWRDW